MADLLAPPVDPSPALALPRGWYRGCPQHGTPACTYGDRAPLASCKYCRGEGFCVDDEADPPSVLALLSLFTRGADVIYRAEKLAAEAFGAAGLRVDRAAWYAVSERDFTYYRARFSSTWMAIETIAQWASRGAVRPGDGSSAFRELDSLGFCVIDAAGHTVVLGVPFL